MESIPYISDIGGRFSYKSDTRTEGAARDVELGVDEDDHALPQTSPPYWTQSQQRPISTISIESAHGGITLKDNTKGDDSNNSCWAKRAYIENHVVIHGNTTGVGAFVVWNITMETLNGNTMRIRKRYSEFEDLRKKLLRTFPCSEAAMPTLPCKSVISKFRPKFLENRRIGLQYFLNHYPPSTMALPPKFAGQKFTASATPNLHTLELFLDYVCPFSAKMFNTVYTHVFQLIKQKYADRVQVLFRQQIQPWHPSSTLVHEAGVAVLKLRPDFFWEFSEALFKQASTYYDISVVSETRNRTYERLSVLGASVGVDQSAMYDLLKIADKAGEDGALNTGNRITDDLKVLVKMNRLVGVHVTPTVLLDGVVRNEVSSGWDAQRWAEWLEVVIGGAGEKRLS